MPIPDAEILARLQPILRAVFRAPDLEASRALTADDVDGWDSLSHARFILEVERRFGVRFPGDRLFDLNNVGDLVDLIRECAGPS